MANPTSRKGNSKLVRHWIIADNGTTLLSTFKGTRQQVESRMTSLNVSNRYDSFLIGYAETEAEAATVCGVVASVMGQLPAKV